MSDDWLTRKAHWRGNGCRLSIYFKSIRSELIISRVDANISTEKSLDTDDELIDLIDINLTLFCYLRSLIDETRNKVAYQKCNDRYKYDIDNSYHDCLSEKAFTKTPKCNIANFRPYNSKTSIDILRQIQE